MPTGFVPEERDGAVIIALEMKNFCQMVAVRVELLGNLGFSQSFIQAAGRGEDASQFVVGLGVARVDFYGLPIFLLRSAPVEVIPSYVRQLREGLGRIRIER